MTQSGNIEVGDYVKIKPADEILELFNRYNVGSIGVEEPEEEHLYCCGQIKKVKKVNRRNLKPISLIYVEEHDTNLGFYFFEVDKVTKLEYKIEECT